MSTHENFRKKCQRYQSSTSANETSKPAMAVIGLLLMRTVSEAN